MTDLVFISACSWLVLLVVLVGIIGCLQCYGVHYRVVSRPTEFVVVYCRVQSSRILASLDSLVFDNMTRILKFLVFNQAYRLILSSIDSVFRPVNVQRLKLTHQQVVYWHSIAFAIGLLMSFASIRSYSLLFALQCDPFGL